MTAVREPLMQLAVTVEGRERIGPRRLVRYWGGCFEGMGAQGPSGAVVGGADHGRPRHDGQRHLMARLVLEAEDGTPLTLLAEGLGPPDGPLAVSAYFEAPAGVHEWLCRTWAVGTVEVEADGERWTLDRLVPRGGS